MDILEEIKADIERERYARLWQRYGYFLVIGIIAIILGTAGTVWWQNRMLSQQEALGNRFEEAVIATKKNELPEALALFDAIARDDQKSAGFLASFNKAAIWVKQGKQDEAITLYDKMAAEKNADPALQQLASLLGVYLRMEAGKEGDKVAAALEKLSAKDGIWRSKASELKGLQALHKGDIKQAKTIFEALAKEEETPSSIKERAAQIIAGLE